MKTVTENRTEQQRAVPVATFQAHVCKIQKKKQKQQKQKMKSSKQRKEKKKNIMR